MVEGDITAQRVDVIVNAANSSLLGGGGVDGAIHRKGGPEILAETRMLRASKYGRGLPTGQAVATTAGRLPARWVVHTVGPVFSADEDRSDLLRACYANALRVADELGAASIAFPLISAGIYRWPVDDAVRQALTVLGAARPECLRTATLVLFGADTAATARPVPSAFSLAILVGEAAESDQAEVRMISSVGRMMAGSMSGSPTIRRSNWRAITRPASAIGWRTVVSGGSL